MNSTQVNHFNQCEPKFLLVTISAVYIKTINLGVASDLWMVVSPVVLTAQINTSNFTINKGAGGVTQKCPAIIDGASSIGRKQTD